MATTHAPTFRHVRLQPRALEWARSEWLCLVAVAWYVAILALLAPRLFTGDTWVMLASGREVARDLVPDADTLTVIAQGRDWVDQQWLAQLVFYGAAKAGLRWAFLLHVVVLGCAAAILVTAARRRGGSLRSTALACVLMLIASSWGWYVRTQALAFVIYALLLWLLVEDRTGPRVRTLGALVLLAVWANLHGSVLLGAAAVVVYGFFVLAGRGRTGHERFIAALLCVGAPLATLVSPYGTDLLAYYDRMLLHPPFRDFVVEWQQTPLTLRTAPFWLAAVGAALLVIRRRRAFAAFELALLALTLVSAVIAIRGVVWFALAGIVLLPHAVDLESPFLARRRTGSHDGAFALSVVVAAIGLIVWTVASFPARLSAVWPGRTADEVRAFVGADHSSRVFADEWLADWLLWNVPELRGRLAYDARVELLTRAEISTIVRFESGARPDAAIVRPYSLFVLRSTDRAAVASLRAHGFHVVDRDALAVVARRDK